ncbi:MAG: gamma-glutamylcyclotransferase family protein [Gammaproteobacteria bacterium]
MNEDSPIEHGDYLFVYGTLRRGFAGEWAQWLSRRAEFCGEGYCYGKLYEIDRYPGLVLSGNRNHRVIGELYRPRDWTYVLAALDEYEECAPRFRIPHEYRRIRSGVRAAGDRSVAAWLYVYNRPVENLKRIPSGDYLRHAGRPGFKGRVPAA